MSTVIYWKTKAKRCKMIVCTQKKLEKKLATHSEKKKSSTVITVKKNLLQNHPIMPERKSITAQGCATQMTGNITISPTNKTLGRVGLAAMSLIKNGCQRIKNVCRTSRQDATQEKRGLRVFTLLKNGKDLKAFIMIGALFAKKVSYSQKTMLCHYQKAAQTILLTYSHYAEIVIVKSRLSFDIYETPELLKEAA